MSVLEFVLGALLVAFIAIDFLLWITMSMQGLKIDSIEQRAERLERKINRIVLHLGIADADAAPQELSAIRELLLQGSKIDAIKAYREEYNVGLKEAKDAVDAIEEML